MTTTPVRLALVQTMAAERTRDRPDLFDDAVQEGLIAAWRAQEAHPDASPTYLTGAARNGVRGAVAGRAPFGHSPHRGTQDAADSSIPTDSDLFPDPEDPTSAAALAAVEVVVELAEVRTAVRDLCDTDRDIVRLRFVEGLDWKDVAARLGTRGSNATRRRFIDHIAPALRTALPHLEELVA